MPSSGGICSASGGMRGWFPALTAFQSASRRRGSSGCPSTTAVATSTTLRPRLRAWSRSIAKAARSSMHVALHEDALGALDHRAPLERRLQLRDLLGQLRLLGVPAQRELDRDLDLVRVLRPGEAVDPARGGTGEEVPFVGRLHDRDDRPAGGLAQLVDEIQRVLEVVVDRDDGEVRVLLGDAFGGLADGHRVGGHVVAQLAQHPCRRVQRLGVLVGDEDGAVPRSCRSWNSWFPRRRSPRYHPSGVRA